MPEALDKVHALLSQAEALVLFEFLSRFSDGKKLEVQDPSEKRVLLDLLCTIEKQLAQPFEPKYGEALRKARKSVADGENA